jgi:poly-beta-hydroxyalkanoate depolymerase
MVSVVCDIQVARILREQMSKGRASHHGIRFSTHDLCPGLKPYMKTHCLQAGVGHNGVFNGRRWDSQIYPVLRNHIQSGR